MASKKTTKPADAAQAPVAAQPASAPVAVSVSEPTAHQPKRLRIAALEAENAKLRAEIAELKK